MDKKELIVKHFTQKLSQEEQKEFDLLMASDSNFAKEVAFQKDLKTAIKKEEQDILKKQLQDFEAEKNSAFNYKNWLVAASVVVLLGMSSFWYFNNSIDPQELYVENFEPYRNVVQPIVRGETKTDLKTKAFTAYETKNYTDALQYFNELLKENPDETIAFYKANVLLKLNKTGEAMAILKKNLIIDSLNAKNNWYLALAYLKITDIKNAKKHLKIVNSNPLSDYKNEEAKKVLKQLE
ncbi:tetratricopeptide repeat protein [Psychroserpens sp.]